MSILIGTITSHIKDYCFLPWMANVQKIVQNTELVLEFSPEVYVVDNSHFGQYKHKLSIYANVDKVNSLSRPQETLASAHNRLREYFLASDCEWLLHLESDVFPPEHVISALLLHEQMVVCCPYIYGEGERSRYLIHLVDQEGAAKVVHQLIDNVSLECKFLDGKLKRVHSAGLGCTLIHRSVLEQITFKSHPQETNFPDTYFFNDCLQLNIPVYLDTSLLCEHRQQNWFLNPDYKL